MPVNTTNMGLPKGIDSDNSEAYLVGPLATGLDKIDVHRHTGGADGLTVPASGLAAGAATGAALGTDVVTLTGAQTLTNKSLTSPAITGTVVGSAGFTTPSLNNPAINGTVSGGASYTAPTLTTPSITSPAITGTVTGSAGYTTPFLTSPTLAGHLHASGSAPGIANGAGIGGGGSTSIQGNDIRGIASLVVGTAPGTLMATVTFALAFTAAPCVVVSLNGNGPGAVSLYTTNITTTTFEIRFTAAPVASQTYQVMYHAIDMG